MTKNWYKRYKADRFYDRCRYDVNKAQFIATMLAFGYHPCEVFTCGFLHKLLPHGKWKRDKRISERALYVKEYPLYMDWLKALREWNVLIGKEDFDKVYVCNDEPFYKVFHQWEYTLKHFSRYIMQHETIYGKKKMWEELLVDRDKMIEKLGEMYDNVETEFQNGEISWEEKESRQQEIMDTWRIIQP